MAKTSKNTKMAIGKNIIQVDNVYFFPEQEDVVFTTNNDIAFTSFYKERTEEAIIKNEIECNERAILLWGLGGVGKTHFCRVLFNEYLNLINKTPEKTRIRHLGYLTYNNSFDETLINGIKYKRINNYVEDLKNSWEKLEKISQTSEMLLIIDNVDCLPIEDPSLNKLNQLSGTIIITSRRNDFEYIKKHEIQSISVNDALSLFKDINTNVDDNELEDLNYIVETLVAGHTYTIELLAHISFSQDWSILRLRNELDKRKFNIAYVKSGQEHILKQEYKKLFSLSKLSKEEIMSLRHFLCYLICL